MSKELYIIVGILIPFLGTSLGSFFVFFLKKEINNRFKKFMLGFASGVMLAACIWSLILPSIELANKKHVLSFLPASIGLTLGIFFLIIITKLTDTFFKKKNKDINVLFLSVTLHNIPEGMAVGVCFASFLYGTNGIDLLAAFLLSIGIAIQNIPEGAIISIPSKIKGNGNKKSFIWGIVSGVVEPLAAFITLILTSLIEPLLPYFLSFASGAMIYVIFEELVPEMHEGYKSSFGITGLLFGFIVMMILDVALG